MSRLFALRKSIGLFSRNASTLGRSATNKKPFLMGGRFTVNAQRNMGGHGPDISKMEAALYIIVGGGGFAAFGMYQTKHMRDRIEAFETGNLIPFKSLSDDEFSVFREKFRRLHCDEEDEEESSEEESSEDAQEPEESIQVDQEEVNDESSAVEDDDLSRPRRIAKSPKDTVIFVEAPKE